MAGCCREDTLASFTGLLSIIVYLIAEDDLAAQLSADNNGLIATHIVPAQNSTAPAESATHWLQVLDITWAVWATHCDCIEAFLPAMLSVHYLLLGSNVNHGNLK